MDHQLAKNITVKMLLARRIDSYWGQHLVSSKTFTAGVSMLLQLHQNGAPLAVSRIGEHPLELGLVAALTAGVPLLILSLVSYSSPKSCWMSVSQWRTARAYKRWPIARHPCIICNLSNVLELVINNFILINHSVLSFSFPATDTTALLSLFYLYH
jgi:hypothetical protein